ncbi:MAG: N-acyl-D-glucosamine 2-epimerase [Verrucomicrobiae bacterium]|nr:N-acyl-D-glucosamine 2-epimerase [Verrucomicrobiae bacterium]
MHRILGQAARCATSWWLICTAWAVEPWHDSIQVDPSFPYYRDRSTHSVAAELRANGYRTLRYLVTSEQHINTALVAACRQIGLRVCYGTFGNGSYATRDLPAGWEAWRMRLRDPFARAPDYTYLCMNHPEYRRWKKAQIVQTLQRITFDGLEIVECFWPAFRGPESPLYGCLCAHCVAAFRREFPDEPGVPNFDDPAHPSHFKTNRALYARWQEFRARSVASFLDEIINGPGGVRRRFPKLPVAIWGIAADVPAPVITLRAWEGIDGALLVSTVRPDLYVLQTDWPDWMKPDLPPDYPLRYKPFVEAIRATGSRVPIQLQTDIGSAENCRRGRAWLRACELAARRAGMNAGVTAYEYHLSRDIYESPPRPVTANARSSVITLVFNKRLDAVRAADPAHYRPSSGEVLSAKVDGNLVELTVSGRPDSITVSGLADDPTRRLFKNHPPATMPKPIKLAVRWN